MNKERMEQIEKLAAGFRKEWVPETDNEHRVLAYSDDRDEYDEVFEACNDAVAQGIIEMRTAIPELLAALKDEMAINSFTTREVIPAAIRERDALRTALFAAHEVIRLSEPASGVKANPTAFVRAVTDAMRLADLAGGVDG